MEDEETVETLRAVILLSVLESLFTVSTLAPLRASPSEARCDFICALLLFTLLKIL